MGNGVKYGNGKGKGKKDCADTKAIIPLLMSMLCSTNNFESI
jgi:hypothetical protein